MNFMKTQFRAFLLLALLGSVVSACKSKNSAESIDLRAQYVGTYSPVQYQAVTYVGNIVSAPDQGVGELVVAKGTGNNKEIFITINFPGYTEQLAADLDGTKFKVTSKNKEALSYLNKTVNADYSASGEFTTDNKIALSIVVQTTDNSTVVKKLGAFTGPKK